MRHRERIYQASIPRDRLMCTPPRYVVKHLYILSILSILSPICAQTCTPTASSRAPVPIVNVARHLLALWVAVSNEHDGGELAVAHSLLPVLEGLCGKWRIACEVGIEGCARRERLHDVCACWFVHFDAENETRATAWPHATPVTQEQMVPD